jgi:hypothetical protein
MCSDAPTPDPGLGEAARANAQTAKEGLDFYKSIYKSDIAPRMARDQQLREDLIGDMRSSMMQQKEFADKQNAYYESTFKPIEQKMAQEAMDYDSQANIQRRQGIAAAAVNQQYANAAGQQSRLLSRYGLNPNSSAFARENAKLTNAQALASAGAQTGAAFDTMDRGIALRAGAAGFGRNMPNTAAQYYGLQGAGAGQMANMSSQGIGNVAQGASVMGQGFNTNIQGNTAAGNLFAQDFQGRMQGYQAEQAATGALMGGLGTMAGMALGGPMGAAAGKAMFGGKADGGPMHSGPGHVRGPGGPVDDKIPAMLSDGEYVIPADVVKAKGVEFFEKLKSKYHTPAAVQRMGMRRS